MSALPLQTIQDSKYFSIESDDPAIRTDTEGGYEFTRARFTRRPRRTYTTGFSFIKQADYVVLQQFWDDMKGGSLAFDWTIPTTGVTIAVRFKKAPSFRYVGIGGVHRYDVTLELKEV